MIDGESVRSSTSDAPCRPRLCETRQKHPDAAPAGSTQHTLAGLAWEADVTA